MVDSPVLITGETGTGKELVARMLHEQSPRSACPFMPMNCAALPSGLFHAEIFGHERGAFTGANRRYIGRVESAEGGSLLLDEIGELPMDMQVVLLRFLEEGIFERLGSIVPIQANVRVIAATSSQLERDCQTGRFREELYYRLNSLRVRTPPLRDRGSDIELLASHFLKEFTRDMGLPKYEFAPDALLAMRNHEWPGNVRELRNRIRQSLVLGDSRLLHARDLELDINDRESIRNGDESPPSLQECRNRAELKAIQRVLNDANGDVATAAARLRVSRAQLYRLIRRHRLRPRHSDINNSG